MHHTYAPTLSPVSPNLSENGNAIRELQNQLSREKFIEKLATFAKTATPSNAGVPTTTARPALHTLKKTGVPAAGICFALSSIAASPLGNQINLNPLTDWVSDAVPEHVQHVVQQQVDSPQETAATEQNAIAPSSPALDLKQLPSPQQAFFMDTLDNSATPPTFALDTASVRHRSFFMDTLFHADAPKAHPNSGLVINGLSLEKQAFLMTIAQAEGATYTTIYGGSQFTDFSKHPHQCIPITLPGYEGMCSDAAGKYQFLSSTWALLNLPDFSPVNQDRGAVMLIQETNAFNLLEQGDIAGAFCSVGAIWASLPCNAYGQNPKSLGTLVAMYEDNLQHLK